MAAYELKKSVAKVGASPSNFCLYKGEDGDQVLVSAAAPSPQILQEITKECGKVTLVLKGLCFREGDILVFATKSAPAPQWKMQISKILKERKCQGVSQIELRQLGADQSDQVGGEVDGASGDGSSTEKKGEAKSGLPLLPEWKAARDAAVGSVGELVKKLRATGHAGAAKAGEVVHRLAGGFPAGLDKAYASFDKASAAKDAKALSVARAQAKAQTDACLAYLKTNQKLIGMCEANPFGANVAVSAPLTAALQSIAARLG